MDVFLDAAKRRGRPMSETIGPWTVTTAEGVLRPAQGIVETSPGPPPTYDTGQAAGVVSKITTAKAMATPAAALVEVQSYRSAVGSVLTFRGVPCFVADVEPDHQAAEADGGQSFARAVWSLVAPLTWVPEMPT